MYFLFNTTTCHICHILYQCPQASSMLILPPAVLTRDDMPLLSSVLTRVCEQGALMGTLQMSWTSYILIKRYMYLIACGCPHAC